MRSPFRWSDSPMAGERAVIDIGSNTVRMVVFDGPPRAPRVVFNEKVAAKLGKGVYETSELSPKSMHMALAALNRFSLLLKARKVASVEVVATAASRDARNGGVFLAEVARLGLKPRLISGEEEALTSALGVIGAFPAAKGVVADLGGGSLELVHVADGTSEHGCSLPFGSLRLPDQLVNGSETFNRAVRKAIKASGLACVNGDTLYLVGGSHRALARFSMLREGWLLDDPHGYSLSGEHAVSMCRALRSGHAPAAVPGLSASRTASLPPTAALLSELIREIKPATVVFSSWGLREGVYLSRLSTQVRGENPLVAGVADFARRQGVSMAFAEQVSAWTSDPVLVGPDGDNGLRLAAILLTLASQRIEPNLRAEHALDWTLRKRWVGVTAEGRAIMAACALANCGADPARPELLRLAGPAPIRRGAIWGQAVRLCRRLTGGAVLPNEPKLLHFAGGKPEVILGEGLNGLLNEGAQKDRRALGALLETDTAGAMR